MSHLTQDQLKQLWNTLLDEKRDSEKNNSNSTTILT